MTGIRKAVLTWGMTALITSLALPGTLAYADGQLEGAQTVKGEAQADFTNKVREAIHHAMEAKSAGKQSKAEALVKHAKQSLDFAKQAQRYGLNERLNEGVYALGEAIEHGQRKQTTDATEHMMHAIMKLSQSAGLQIPEGVETGQSATN